MAKVHVPFPELTLSKNCLGNCVYLTSNCVLIFAVNVIVNFQIKLNPSILKANFSTFTKLNVQFNISLLIEHEDPNHYDCWPCVLPLRQRGRLIFRPAIGNYEENKIRVVLTLRAWNKELVPSSPMELRDKSRNVREVFTLKAWDREMAPSSPMKLQDKSKEVRELFTVKAWERELAPSLKR